MGREIDVRRPPWRHFWRGYLNGLLLVALVALALYQAIAALRRAPLACAGGSAGSRLRPGEVAHARGAGRRSPPEREEEPELRREEQQR